jgi:hypothetical protein
MKLRLRRIALRDTYTIGKLEVLHLGQWQWIADTCEDKVRDINKDGDLNDTGEGKIMHETAIPYGEYEITLDIQSPKYSNFTKYPWSREFDGYLPRLLNVKHFTGILIHVGNHKGHSSGCILVGENKVVGNVINSTATFKRIMREWFVPAKERNEKITIEII